MGTTRYTVIDGEILSEDRDGVKRDYMPDPQGNTIALLDNTQTITDTFSYYPYGEVASRTGTTPTPFQYLGTLGYYSDNSSRSYVRARVLHKAHGRWMSEDPIFFDSGDLNLYRYAKSSPITLADPSGLRCKEADCHDRTKFYCDQSKYHDGKNRALNCFCRASRAVCDLITHSGKGFPNQQQQNWLDCMNRCIFEYYSSQSTSRWERAARICKKKGDASEECCRAYIEAEQNAYTTCLQPAGSSDGGFKSCGPPPTPAPSLGAFPINGTQQQRGDFGKQMCCPKNAKLGDPHTTIYPVPMIPG